MVIMTLIDMLTRFDRRFEEIVHMKRPFTFSHHVAFRTGERIDLNCALKIVTESN